METNSQLGSDLAFVINVHERLVRDFPITPYQQWCSWVHQSSYAPKVKWERLLSWDLNPQDYANPTIFAHDYQLRSFLTKFSSEEYSDDIGMEKAYRKFLDSEIRCSHVNDLLTSRIRPSGLNQLLELAKKIVADCLGDVTDMFGYFSDTLDRDPAPRYVSLSSGDPFFDHLEQSHGWAFPEDHPEGFTFGPGVSVGDNSGSLSSIVEKLECSTVTANCWGFIAPVMRRLRHPRPSLVQGSKLTFVPKKVGEMRAICYEPSMNMLVQKWVGKWIRRKLKAYFGINLRSQVRNRRLAHLGSLCDSWATIDLSSASDLNAYALVLELLPHHWFSVLDSIRSPGYHDPEKGFVEFHKFSTMGNGFTFELETLIFAAISLASIKLWGDSSFSRRDICCYGDDICVPREHYEIVCQGLAVIGHSPNLLKSFSHGPFRESCGGDFFNGWDVTPIKVKELQLETPRTVIELHNRLFAYSRDSHPGLIDGTRFSRALEFIQSWLKRHYPRVSGGDVELIYDKQQQCTLPVSSNQWLWGVDWNRGRSYDGTLVPKWLCIEVKRTICEFHVPPSSVSWLVGLKQGATVHTETSCEFQKNSSLLTWAQLCRRHKASVTKPQ